MLKEPEWRRPRDRSVAALSTLASSRRGSSARLTCLSVSTSLSSLVTRKEKRSRRTWRRSRSSARISAQSKASFCSRSSSCWLSLLDSSRGSSLTLGSILSTELYISTTRRRLLRELTQASIARGSILSSVASSITITSSRCTSSVISSRRCRCPRCRCLPRPTLLRTTCMLTPRQGLFRLWASTTSARSTTKA